MNDGCVRQEFVRFRNRLALFRESAEGADYWEKRWSTESIARVLAAHEDGSLGEYEAAFIRYLPRHARVLEAGCGMGQVVTALRARGYNVEGIDYAEQTIRKALAADRDLRLRVGDIYNISEPAAAYGGYVSLGVLEHHPDGPQAGLREARRVLADDGVACISVPFLNVARRRMLRTAPVVDSASWKGLEFYQYYFDHRDFGDLVACQGFRVEHVSYYAAYAALTRETQVGRWLHRHRFFGCRVRSIVMRSLAGLPGSAKRPVAHMALYVCRPV